MKPLTTAALAEAARLALPIFEHLEIGLCYLDIELRFHLVNASLAQLHGIPIAAHLGRTVAEVVPELAEHMELVSRHLIEAGEAVLAREVEVEPSRSGGATRTLRHSSYPVCVAGEVVGFCCVFEDISRELRAERARKSAEEELRALTRRVIESRESEQPHKPSLPAQQALLRQFHHRVTNDLQVISSLLYLQSARTGSERVRAALTGTRSRVHVMAAVHSCLSTSNEAEEIDLAEFLGGLISSIGATYRGGGKNFELVTHLTSVVSGIERALPCGLIMNELVTNAFEHGLSESSERGRVEVSLSVEAGRVCLGVSDAGGGMPGSGSRRGSEGLGLELVHLLARQIDGVFTLPAPGESSFRLSFELAPGS